LFYNQILWVKFYKLEVF